MGYDFAIEISFYSLSCLVILTKVFHNHRTSGVLKSFRPSKNCSLKAVVDVRTRCPSVKYLYLARVMYLRRSQGQIQEAFLCVNGHGLQRLLAGSCPRGAIAVPFASTTSETKSLSQDTSRVLVLSSTHNVQEIPHLQQCGSHIASCCRGRLTNFRAKGAVQITKMPYQRAPLPNQNLLVLCYSKMARLLKMLPRAGLLGRVKPYLPPLNFITIHYLYFIGTSLVTSIIFYCTSTPAWNITYTDSLFLVISAMTEVCH